MFPEDTPTEQPRPRSGKFQRGRVDNSGNSHQADEESSSAICTNVGLKWDHYFELSGSTWLENRRRYARWGKLAPNITFWNLLRPGQICVLSSVSKRRQVLNIALTTRVIDLNGPHLTGFEWLASWLNWGSAGINLIQGLNGKWFNIDVSWCVIGIHTVRTGLSERSWWEQFLVGLI